MSASQILALCADAVLLIGASSIFIICLFFLLECVAALLPIASFKFKDSWHNIKVVVLVPAHNEELVIGKTLEKLTPVLKKQDRLVVVADNCTDATAKISRAAGATVIERHDSSRRGKGYALDYGLRFIESEPPDVVVLMDADCIAHPGAVEQLSQYAIATGQPVQSIYLMTKDQNSKSSRDFVAQFANIVRNLVRTRGSAFLGVPCLLNGTGMAFPWAVIRSVNLASGHIVEDMKLGLDLTLTGYKPIFCSEATVTGCVPSQAQAARTQKTRWEHGHLQMIQAYLPILLKEAVKQRRFDLMMSALDLCVPPLSLLAIIWLAVMISSLLGVVLGASWIPFAIAATAGFCFLSGILVAWARFASLDLPLGQLLTIPLYVLWKIPVYFKFLIKPQSTWIRTERDVT
ncbi:glycosyltransferase [Scytonema sp. UIC 10036]|uniref:glycosyltransferase family 2 protein n=1 Tax=Scytonema sp. UIC 10036 TaxID=2304196 RepID=UPI0012DAA621|nr:glycosyltransferase family 2 protein [Scytonema sp. UIC 10036]MUH01197.1 glycosyltransferase [Scytonema sp. UIC 10036]